MISSTKETAQEWIHQRSLRRFPENHSSKMPSKTALLKSELQTHHSWSSRDNENDRKLQSLLSASLMQASHNRQSESESPTNSVLPKRTSPSSPAPPVPPPSSSSTSGEDASFNHLINYMSSQTKSNTKSVKQYSLSKESDASSPETSPKPIVPQQQQIVQCKESFAKSVLQSGDYLLKYDSWHEFRGADEIKTCSKKVIERNENIWELVSIEYSHFRLLLNIREVYYKSYPYLEAGMNQSTMAGRRSSTTRSDSIDSTKSISIPDTKERLNNLFESIDTILPGIDQLIEFHARICDCLISNHVIRPDRVITEIGRVLHESIPDEFIPSLAELYGRINYTKQYINQKLSQFKKYPVFLSYIHKCERDPKCDKKTLADILLHISIHWSKKVTTLNTIILNTINDSQDLNSLMKFKEKVDKIVNEASNVMDSLMNSKLLQSIVENYEVLPDVEDSERVFRFMTVDNAKLIYNGKVQFELRKNNNGKLSTREVQGVALEECIFFLQIINDPNKTSPRYQLFKERDSVFPALLEWGKLYGYFREEDSKNSDAFSFYVIIEKPEPSIKRLFVGTPHDRSYWKKCMMQGFSRWQSDSLDIKDADNQLSEEMKKINKKWKNTQFGIDLIKNLDDSLRVQLEYRTVGFRCILEEELKRLIQANGLIKGTSSNSVSTVTDTEPKKDESDTGNASSLETYLPDLTTRDGIHDWLEVFMEWVNRLKFSLCSSGANITRSASEIEARKRPSIPTVKKYDTFTSRDSPTYEKRHTDVTFQNPPIAKQKKDQRRISVSGFTNLFRMSTKAVKCEESDTKGAVDCTAPSTANQDCDIDNIALLNRDAVSDRDCFLPGLSKDTVAAFNEINIATKNITIELLNLRTKNMILEAEVKKIQEENQSFREFLRKYQKSAGDNQSGIVIGNHCQQKSDIVNSPLGIGINASGSIDLSMEGLEALGESSSGFAHINQKMVECRRQTENLRQMYDQFAKEKKIWEKEYEAQRRKIENDRENLFQKNMELQAEKDSLMKREEKYNENFLNLHKKMELCYKTYGINLDDEPLQYDSEGSVVPNTRLQEIMDMQPHCRSHSDDTSQKRSSKQSIASSGPKSPPLASTEATLYKADHQGKHNSAVSDQLRGSLVHQDRDSLKTNSSDNILENRNKSVTSNASKPKMTPSIERKEMYPSNNMLFSLDDNSSDMDDFQCSSIRKNTPADRNQSQARNSSVANVSPDVSGNKRTAPLSTVTKVKAKKEKSRKFKLIDKLM